MGSNIGQIKVLRPGITSSVKVSGPIIAFRWIRYFFTTFVTTNGQEDAVAVRACKEVTLYSVLGGSRPFAFVDQLLTL